MKPIEIIHTAGWLNFLGGFGVTSLGYYIKDMSYLVCGGVLVVIGFLFMSVREAQ